MTIGVLVMAYGTPARPEQIEQYYTHIRRGRPPSPEQLANLARRYEAIGGISPLQARTTAQVDAIADALGDGFDVRVGYKHAEPFIESTAEDLAGAAPEAVVGLVLAPQFSAGSVEQYHRRAAEVLDTSGVPYRAINSWHVEPAFVEFMAEGLRKTLASLPDRTKVVFTAHSLPERVLVGDRYPDEVYESAAAVAKAVGLAEWAGWSQVWQSAGATPDPWRGPDILDVIDDLAATGRADGLAVVPVGFVADHLEVLYDLDIEARQRCDAHGLAFGRAPVVNADPGVMRALASRVREASG